MTRFALTWDYRCPFARNAHEHVAAALQGGAPYEVEFVPFSLAQVHVEEGQPDVWDDPEKAPGMLATEVGLAVQRLFPDRFLGAHVALFAARHDEARDIRERSVLSTVLEAHGVDASAVFAEVDSGATREEFRVAHEKAVSEYSVFGVPTFIMGSAERGPEVLPLLDSPRAVFVRIMTRPAGDATLARTTIDKVLSLMETSPEINEFKYTTIAR